MANKTRHNDTASTAVTPTAAATTREPGKITKLALVEQMLRQPGGATIADLMSATGWQQHSVRGALSGALRKRGLVVTSAITEGVRRYTARTQ